MADTNFTPQEIEQFLQQFFDVVGARQYVGARYVPIFGRMGEDTIDWDDGAPYEPLTVVRQAGNSYVSRRYVPEGVAVTNTDYWAKTYDFNAQVEGFAQQVENVENALYNKLPWPTADRYGDDGHVLGTDGHGAVAWVDPAQVTPEVAGPIIDSWLESHPEATTTVEDGSITTAKLADGAVTPEKLAQAVTIAGMNQYGNFAEFRVTESVYEDYTMVKGTKYLIQVRNNSLTGDLNIWSEGDTTDYVQIRRGTTSAVREYVAAATGRLRLYTTASSGSATVGVVAVPYGRGVEVFQTYLYDQPLLATSDLRDSTAFRPGRSLGANSYYSVFMAQAHSLVNPCNLYGPIQVREPDGTLRYKLRLSGLETMPTNGQVAHLFDHLGNYVTNAGYADRSFLLQDGSIVVPEGVYYVILQTYDVHGGGYFTIDPRRIEWLQTAAIGTKDTYVVDQLGTGDFTSLTACLRHLNGDTTKKTIYVMAGYYSVYQEMGGADYIATITEPETMNWRDVSVIVPDNTSIIGVGAVTIAWDAPASVMSSSALASLFSPINCEGNVTLENLTVIGQNCRYAIHDECSGNSAMFGRTHTFRNLRLEHTGDYINVCFGCGYGNECSFVFENVECHPNGGTSMYFHDWDSTVEGKGTKFWLSNVNLHDTRGGYIRLGSSLSVESRDLHDTMVIDSSHVGGVEFDPNTSGQMRYSRVDIESNLTPDYDVEPDTYLTIRTQPVKNMVVS